MFTHQILGEGCTSKYVLLCESSSLLLRHVFITHHRFLCLFNAAKGIIRFDIEFWRLFPLHLEQI